jgi:tetratricopeptide (TPR) repeat protein
MMRNHARIGALAGILTLLLAAPWAAAGISAVTPSVEAGNSSDRIQKLIQQLGDSDYFVRQKAQSELTKIGFEAYDALLDATTHEDLEIAARAKYLLRLIRVEWTVDSDPPEVKRLLHDYEFKDSDDRKRQMAALAELPDNAGVLSLCRLVRFAQSEEYSKLAAVEILKLQPFGDDLSPDLGKTILKGLGNSRRVAARWLLTYQRLREDPAAGLPGWARLADAEQTLLRRSPNQTTPQIVSTVLRIQASALKRLHRIDETLTVMQRLIELERDDLASLVDLLEWLLDQKAWKLVDDVAARFDTRFAGNTVLLYLLAESQAGRGDTKAAEKTVRKAREYYPGGGEQILYMHLVTANRLFRRGKYAWSEQEFRDLIAKGGVKSPCSVKAYLGLGEMFHDQNQDQKAADVLQSMFDQLGKGKGDDVNLADHSVGEYRARLHYYLSCVCHQQGKTEEERAHLEQGLDAFPPEIDVLIASYQLSRPASEYRRKILDLIRKAGDEIREQIASSPQEAVPYNQLAWLIANTEGDFDEALKFSKTSLELDPGNGGFYDTLGRVYFARRDYASAVKYQTKAVELEPHYGLIARQLEFFKKALAEQSKKPAAATPAVETEQK